MGIAGTEYSVVPEVDILIETRAHLLVKIIAHDVLLCSRKTFWF